MHFVKYLFSHLQRFKTLCTWEMLWLLFAQKGLKKNMHIDQNSA